jgi:putative endopeptidase
VNAFSVADLDASKNACADFNGYVNGKWLAANPIPSDRTSWGSMEVLAERSIAIQHQLAEQAAADAKATGVEKIVGDFWATGMDEAKIEAQGIKPIEGRLAELDKLTDADSISAYLRDAASKGEAYLFDFGPEADFKNSEMNIAYATQGGLGLPDTTYYKDAEYKQERTDYEAHIAKVLETGGCRRRRRREQAKT